ncbi:MAG: riboflavin synthase [Anaerovoracaceae bacterium]|jgi:riboflavin synthase
MFTGLIEEKGTIKGIRRGADSSVLTIAGELIFSDLRIGDSVAVNGVCLTATGIDGHSFTADVMHETLSRSGLGGLRPGSAVNLERAMPADGRFGGHIVSGHIDGTGTIVDIRRDDNAIWYTVRTEPALMRYIVEKGSIAIDGISLTVARVEEDRFAVSIIPHTASATTLAERHVGDTVNLENDIIGKYIEKLMQAPQETTRQTSADAEGGITWESLARAGF